ncbi:major facilitator superfamily domain-containing protein [Zopfochytrium polystomum]|nr:major facilitator superfamily domain-containing protein [Zopfochytrium polystomum]
MARTQPAVEADSPPNAATSVEDRQNLHSVVILAIAFFLIFTAYGVVQSLASSVLPYNIAFVSLGVLYFSFGFFNLILSAPVIESIGCRPSLFLGSITYVILEISYVVAILNDGKEYIQAAVLIPSSILIGLGASLLWTAQGTYISRAAGPSQKEGRYGGIFQAISGLASVLGPLMTSILFQANVNKVTVFSVLCVVGGLGCAMLIVIWLRPEPGSRDSEPPKPTNEELRETPLPVATAELSARETVPHTAASSSVASFEVPTSGSAGLLLDSAEGGTTAANVAAQRETSVSAKPPSPDSDAQGARMWSQIHRLLDTAKMIIHPRMLLLAPLFYTVAVEQAFSSGSLPLLIHTSNASQDLAHKLYLAAALGAADSITSFFIGPLTDRFGSVWLLSVNAVFHAATVAFLWGGSVENDLARLFGAAVLLGMCDSILLNQIYKLVPSHFSPVATPPPSPKEKLSEHVEEPGATETDEPREQPAAKPVGKSARKASVPPQPSTSVVPAFAAYRFHSSMTSGVFFLSSKAALGPGGFPRLEVWAPLVWALLVASWIGVLLAERWRARL